MFLTSVKLAIKNLTQVEDLSRFTRVHRLAILKPSPQRLAEISVTAASTQTYSEITYPLDIPLPSNVTRVNRPYAKTIKHDRLSEQIPLQDARRMVGVSDTPIDTSAQPVDENPPFRDTRSDSTRAGIVDDSSPNLSPPQNNEASTTDRLQLPVARTESLSRDHKAVRTFAILETTSPGDNPWDLGSALLNWETVMGEHFVDWFLPVKRSPCCNHEHTESHFAIGPAVDRIRASVGFIPPNEVLPQGRHRGKKLSRFNDAPTNRSGLRFKSNDEEMARKTDETELRVLRTRNSRHR